MTEHIVRTAPPGDPNLLLREEVYRTVVEQIVAGRLVPGMRLSERSLAADLGTSRMPVKEALRRLENEGFVRALPRHGIVIATSAQESLQDAIRVRAVLEGLAAALLAKKLDSAGSDREALRTTLSSMVAEMRVASGCGDVEELAMVNARFHDLIRTNCGNRYVPHLSSPVLAVDAVVRRRALSDLREMRRGVTEHAQIARRMLHRDPAGAESAMRCHIQRSGEFVLGRMTADRQAEEQRR